MLVHGRLTYFDSLIFGTGSEPAMGLLGSSCSSEISSFEGSGEWLKVLLPGGVYQLSVEATDKARPIQVLLQMAW